MLRRISIYVLLLPCLFAVVGCGPRTYIVNLNPNAFSGMYVTNNELSSVGAPVVFARGECIDTRKDKEHFGISAHYKILTDNEFCGAYYDGLKTFIKSSGHAWADDGKSDVKIDVELLDTQSELLMGFWVVRFMSKLSTKMRFVETKEGATIYQQRYDGYSDIASPFGHESMFKMVVNKSVVDCINKIGTDKGLREALGRKVAAN